jgi:hypothetical protein
VTYEKPPMTRQRAINTLKALEDQGDLIVAHLDADHVLCQLLETLGYKDVVEAWEAVGKTYDLPSAAPSKAAALARR